MAADEWPHDCFGLKSVEEQQTQEMAGNAKNIQMIGQTSVHFLLSLFLVAPLSFLQRKARCKTFKSSISQDRFLLLLLSPHSMIYFLAREAAMLI